MGIVMDFVNTRTSGFEKLWFLFQFLVLPKSLTARRAVFLSWQNGRGGGTTEK
jgi:hypothetical protein